MSRKEKQVRASVWLVTLRLVPGVLAGLFMAWWLPRGFERYGEDH